MEKKHVCLLIFAILFLFIAVYSADSASDKPFYKGKTIRIVVGSPPGGNYDFYARIIARYMSKYIPGNPTMIVQNMPGAGSLIAANYVNNYAKKDGLTIGSWHNILLFYQLLGDRNVKFDAEKIGWVGAPTNESYTCAVMGHSGVKTLDEVLSSKKPLYFGTSNRGYALMVNKLLNAKFRIITGLKGTTKILLAMRRKEVDIACFSWTSLKTELTHYSVEKAADILGIEKIVNIKLNREYEMDPQSLKINLEELTTDGYRWFLVVLTLGYNITGTIDPVDKIDAVLRDAEEGLGIGTYVHLDASFGGLVYPFVSEKPFDFRYPSIKSITLDMHKTGFVPYTAGAFLCRKGLQKYIEHSVNYSHSKRMNNTLSGSRPGIAAVSSWTVIKTLGRNGFAQITKQCLMTKKHFLELLENKKTQIPHLFVSHPLMTIAGFHFTSFHDGRLPVQLENRYGLIPSRLFLDTTQGDKEVNFYRIVFSPHITKSVLEDFTNDLSLLSPRKEK